MYFEKSADQRRVMVDIADVVRYLKSLSFADGATTELQEGAKLALHSAARNLRTLGKAYEERAK